MLNIKDVEKFYTFTVDRDILQVKNFQTKSESRKVTLETNLGSKSRSGSKRNREN